jgi:2-methylcitrate dehydratase PrpD
VTVEFKDGTRLSHTARIAKGHPENPMTELEVLDKFRSNAKAVLDTRSCGTLIDSVRRLESVDNAAAITVLLKLA